MKHRLINKNENRGAIRYSYSAQGKKIPGKIIELFTDVDLILHAGDLINRTVIEQLEIIAKVEVVKGNMDESDNPCSIKKVLNVENVKIG